MKKLYGQYLVIVLLLFQISHGYATDFKAGDNVIITDAVDDDLYVGAGEIKVNARINGDLIAAGGEIYVEDSVMQDILIAGGQLYLNGFVGDDIRASGGRIKVAAHITGDLIIFGGDVKIDQKSVIGGDLIIYGGNITIYGAIKGNVQIAGGNIHFLGTTNGNATFKCEDLEIDGTVNGKSTLVADDLNLGSKARFYNEVSYWTEDEDMDFGQTLVNSQAIFDPNLREEHKIFNGIFGAWGIIYVFSILLMLMLLNLLFGKNMARAAKAANREPAKSLGYGFIFLLGLPLLMIFLMAIIIGIPIGLFLLFIYIFTWVFGLSLASVLTAHTVKEKYNYEKWSLWILLLVSAASFVILKFLTMIPFIGWLFYLLVIAITIGALSFNWMQKKFSKQQQ